jgi:hypothetical protein
MRIGFAILALLLIQPAYAYKCTMKDGTVRTGQTTCYGIGAVRVEREAGDAPEPLSPVAQAQADREDLEKRTAGMQAQFANGWAQLCEAKGGNLGGECQAEQARDFAYMNHVLFGPDSTKAQRKVAGDCYLRWWKESLSVPDASMWRYCYSVR